MKSYNKRKKKTTMVIMLLVRDNIASRLEGDTLNLAKMREKVHDDCDTITYELRQLSEQKLNSFKVN